MIGYFLPALLYLSPTYALLTSISWLLPQEASLASAGFITVSGTLAALALLLSVIVMLFNFQLIRVYEGYSFKALGTWFENALNISWIKAIAKGRTQRHARSFTDLMKEKETLTSRRDALRRTEENYALTTVQEKQDLEEVRNRLVVVSNELAGKYPSEKRLLLPTKFGNVLRSFEDYPRVMYGADATATWTRLIAIMPIDYRQTVADEKAKVDFFLNVSALALLFGLQSLIMGLVSEMGFLWSLLLLLASIIGFFAAYRMSTNAAVGWGNCVKASFDLFLGDLAQKIGLPITTSPETRRSAWLAFSRATHYRDQKALDDSTQPNLKPQ